MLSYDFHYSALEKASFITVINDNGEPPSGRPLQAKSILNKRTKWRESSAHISVHPLKWSAKWTVSKRQNPLQIVWKNPVCKGS